MRRLLSIFLHGFLLDAVLSVLNEWLPISPVRNIVTLSVFLLGLAVYAIAAFTIRLPKRFVLLPVAFLIWVALAAGFPIPFFLPDHAQVVLEWTQLILAVALILAHRPWRQTPPDPDKRAFSWKRLALLSALAVITLPLALTVGVIQGVGTIIETRSEGYIKLRPGGLVLEEREFTKDGKHVRLVSMMHIGDKEFYERIYSSLPANNSAIVLLEGITDEKGLLKNHFSYSRLAGMLGLTSQENSAIQNSTPAGGGTEGDQKPQSNPLVLYRHADVDVSVFKPLTVDFINTISAILSSDSASAALAVISDPNSPLHQDGAEEIVMADILDTRNAHLVAEIDHALQSTQIVIVPWGALHLGAIEAALKERGFSETQRTERWVVRFWKNGTTVESEK